MSEGPFARGPRPARAPFRAPPALLRAMSATLVAPVRAPFRAAPR